MPRIRYFTCDADAEIGEWLGEPAEQGTVDEATWNTRRDSERYHYDTFERDIPGEPVRTETCAIRLRWVP